jgi:hypothetical protein
MMRSSVICSALLAAGLTAGGASAQTFTTDASAMGTPFSPGVRGQAIPAVSINRAEFQVAMPKALEVSRGSSLRGVAGGLEADLFNWKTRNNSPREGTLNYLRYSRDEDADLFVTTNIRGLVQPDPNTPGSQRFYDTSIPTLASLAGDWVRYTNHIVQTYRQGQTVTDPQDQAILNSLSWSSSFPGDSFDKLLRADEAPVPKVKYWEIGNEPRVGLSSSYKVTNSYTFLAPPATPDASHKTDYRERYAALTAAMRAQDPTIKVGPAIQTLESPAEQAVIDTILRPQPDGSFLPVDFIGYHPYQTLNTQTTTTGIETALRGIYNSHLAKVNNLRARIAAAGRIPDSVALVASEHNVSNWSSNDTVNEAQMAHALGNTETIFSFARLGIQDAHYWVWPAHSRDGTEYPEFLASEKLRDHMGDTLLSISASSSDNLHMYTTRDSASGELALWGLNFANSADTTRNTPILNVGGRGKITLYTLGALSGPTTLASANLASDMTGGPTHAVDWKSFDRTGIRLDNLQLSFPAATITLLTIEPWRQVGLPGDVNADGKVGADDVNLINANFNQTERNWWQGDLTGDGIVNSADSAIAAANNGAAVGTRWNAQAGSWFTSSNWQTNIVPNAVNASAYLSDSITADRDLTANFAVTLGTLVFDNPSAYRLVGSGSLKLQTSTSAPARVYVIEGEQTIGISTTIASNTVFDVAQDAALRIQGPLTINSGNALTTSGAGSVSYESSISVQSGGSIAFGTTSHVTSLSLAGSARASITRGGEKVLTVDNLSAGGIPNAWTSQIDLKDNDLIIRSTASARIAKAAEITNQLKQGSNFAHAGQFWTGNGIITSLGGNGSTSYGTIGVAVNDFALLGVGQTGTLFSTFDGQSVGVNDVLVKYTYFGDADLDGAVTTNDYFQIDNGFLGSKTGWINGDFDYDGAITTNDYFLIDNAFLSQSARLAPFLDSASGAATAVPEPAPLAACALAMLILLPRPRPRRE